MKRLKEVERELIQLGYLDHEDEYDSIMCGELGISKWKSRRVKSRLV
ncbi:hypothetical protein ACFRAM_08235 [Paenibacillus sp. NPDC056722]